MTSVNTYLYFNGHCEKAFEFYSSVFKREIKYMGRYKEISEDARRNFPNCEDEHIMHVGLPISKETILMGADIIEEPKKDDEAKHFSLYVSADSRQEASYLFAALSEGGEVKLPIADQFWGSYYGICLDQFGISWKISYSQEIS